MCEHMDEHMSEYNPKWGRASWPIIWNKDYKIQQEKEYLRLPFII